MLQQRFRPVYQKIFVDPFLPKLSKMVTHNQMTLIGLIIGCLAALSINTVPPIITVFILLLSCYCDSLDGSIARYNEVDSKGGQRLDMICDHIINFLVIIGIFLVDPGQRLWWLTIMLSFYVLYAVMFFGFAPWFFRVPVGFFLKSQGAVGRVEFMIFLCLFILLPSLFSMLVYACLVCLILNYVQSLMALISFVYKQNAQEMA